MSSKKLDKINKTLLVACERWVGSEAPDHIGQPLLNAINHVRNLLEIELNIENIEPATR